ncbi:FecR family protein [Steroidobacter sp.]|uniref:FecR family protein n=1 Tax=Steroidobacter sp. TaxID=1978227 RepID=UPI001A391106|nr:FecR domain-containing protein [Steroidobacter sp.]MBL8268609.1 FecR domain-containing protein [Steroidobacter sp.]
MESSHDIEVRAGSWLAKRESGKWSAEDEARFQQWLEASIANRVAFLRQEGAWEHASRLQALKGDSAPGTLPSPDSWRLSPFVSDGSTRSQSPDAKAKSIESSRRWWFPRALAASVLVAVAAGALIWHFTSLGPYYRTPVGGLASVPMKDGSKVTLNTDSAIRMAVTETERRVELERGEVFFEVAKDPNRPFVVSAGNKRVVAVGTKFSVHRVGNDLRVFVTEGKVRLEEGSSSVAQSATPVRGDSNAMLLVAGTITRAADSGVIVQEKPLPEVEDYLSWRLGFLTFRDIPLAEAVAEFNRYNERQIFIQDRSVAEIRFSGKVRPTSFEGFVRLLEDALPIHAEHVNDRIVLTAARAVEQQ